MYSIAIWTEDEKEKRPCVQYPKLTPQNNVAAIVHHNVCVRARLHDRYLVLQRSKVGLGVEVDDF